MDVETETGEDNVQFVTSCSVEYLLLFDLIVWWTEGVRIWFGWYESGPLLHMQTDIFPQDLKSWSCDIWVFTVPIALKFDRHLGSRAAFQILEQYIYNTESRDIETSQGLVARRLTA